MTNTLKLVFDAFISEMPEIRKDKKEKVCKKHKEFLYDYAKKVKKIIEPHILSKSLKYFTYNAEETAEYLFEYEVKTLGEISDVKLKYVCYEIVSGMLCLIDGMSSENDFHKVKTTLIQNNCEGLCFLWGEYYHEP